MRHLLVILACISLCTSALAAGVDKANREVIGGDDVFVDQFDDYRGSAMDISEDGTIFVAVSREGFDPLYRYILIYRSTDGGTTFSLWSQIGSPVSEPFHLQDIDVTAGTRARVFLTYRKLNDPDQGIYVAQTDPTSETPTWTHVPAMTDGVSYESADLATDNASFDDYYLYLVSDGFDSGGNDIWFARSTDGGVTWNTPYRISEIPSPPPGESPRYLKPSISWGFGGVVHVVFNLNYGGLVLYNSMHYVRATNDASGVGDWESPQDMTPPRNDFIQEFPTIAASTTNNSVVMTYENDTYNEWVYRVSDDAGVTWSAIEEDMPIDEHVVLEYHAPSHQFRFVGVTNDPPFVPEVVLMRADADTPLSWSIPEAFSYGGNTGVWNFAMATDESRGGRTAVVWPRTIFPAPTYYEFYFDAEWRDDPGYPNFDTGFPVDLAAAPNSPPAIVNIDGDPYGEIVFGTVDEKVHVYSHLGTIQEGWPQIVPNMTPNAPIAVGALDLTGEPYIVVGSSDGLVFAFDPDGNLRDGFPVDLNTGEDTYVSIGALGGPYPRMIVACSGDKIKYINHRGVLDSWVKDLTGPLKFPAAIGDLDNDGIAETVTLMGPVPGTGWYYLHVFEKDKGAPDAFRAFYSNTWSGAPTLFDLDGDGDLEIAAPTAEGVLFVMHHDGTDVAGFPFNNGTGVPLTSAVAANNRGTSQPEIAVASKDFRVHLLNYTGAQESGYPATTATGWWNFGAPIMDKTSHTWASVTLGSRGYKAWSFDNFGNQGGGWPKALDDHCELSPAAGDIDLDGSNEIVFLTQGQLIMVDVNNPANLNPGWKWPMYGFDPQRTGCLDCEENLVSATPEEGVTRVSFAPPSPNPASGATMFRYQIPAHATVNLEVFDIRGYRVRRVHRSEENAGSYVVHFDGLDQKGRELAAGQYFARLTVRGPGINEVKTRKLTLLR